ncbi:MAG: hypothetical protein H6721_22940 [Sandaracinus sp.]|nr:hypothetical protein [Sandaracinus sp.]MCB9634991.1 hypothetical protein [Sandaracinus sp.]
MTSEERPELRLVPVRTLTPAGWIVGTLHVPKAMPLIDFLEAPRAFVSLSDVKLPTGSELPFFALAKSALILVQPQPEELVEAVTRTSGRSRLRQVSCLFEGGLVMGTLALPSDHRVSDELLASNGFFVLGHCTIGVDAPAKTPVMEAGIHVIVHSPRLLGVTEMKS